MSETMTTLELCEMLGEISKNYRDLNHMTSHSLDMKKDKECDEVAICMLDAAIALQIYVKFKKNKKYICYSTLEPCSHYGKSNPCIEKIINNPIDEVVFSFIDPDIITTPRNKILASPASNAPESIAIPKRFFVVVSSLSAILHISPARYTREPELVEECCAPYCIISP